MAKMKTKRGRKQDRRLLSKQPWELEHVAQKLGCKVSTVRIARKVVMNRAAVVAGQNRRLVEAEVRRTLKRVLG